MCSAYPAIWRGIHSSHSARVIGRIVSSASVTPSSNQARVTLMKDGTASHTARSVAAHRLEYERVAADYGDPAADQALTADVADGQQPNPGRMHEHLRARTAFFDRRGGERARPRRAAGGDRRGRLRRPRPALRQAGGDLVRARPPGHPGGQGRAGRPARPRARAGPLHRGRLHRRPDRGTAARGRPGPGQPDPVPARGRRRLPGTPGRRARPGRLPPGRGRRQRARDERLHRHRDAAAARPLPAAGGRRSASRSDRSSPPTRPATSSRRSAGSRPEPRTPARRRPARWPGPAIPERPASSRGFPGTTSRPRPPRPPSAVGPAVGGAGRVHHRGRQRGRAPPTAPHRQRRPVARRDRRRALAHLPADVGQLPAPPPRRGDHGGRAAPPARGPAPTWTACAAGATSATRPTRAGASGRGPARPSSPLRRAAAPARSGPAATEQTEARWRERFGAAAIDDLRAALADVVARLDPALPDCLPILGYALRSSIRTSSAHCSSRNTRPRRRDRTCRCGRCCPGRCSRSRSSTSARPARPSPSAPTCSA